MQNKHTDRIFKLQYDYTPRSSATTKWVEEQESLESSTLVSQFPDPVQDKVHDLLPDGVVTTSVVVSGILLASDKLLRVEQLTVGASAHLIWKSQKLHMINPYIFPRFPSCVLHPPLLLLLELGCWNLLFQSSIISEYSVCLPTFHLRQAITHRSMASPTKQQDESVICVWSCQKRVTQIFER